MDSPTRGKNTARRSRSWRTAGSNSRRTRSQAIPKPAYIQNLPNELLTDIFLHFLPQYPAFPPLVGPNSPTCLLGVCRRWRNLALHTARLWRAIKVDGDADEEFAVALTWLERSSSALLHLNVGVAMASSTVEESIPPTHPPSQRLFEAIIANRMRWQYLNLVVEDDQADRFSGPAPNLAKLEIAESGHYRDGAHSFILVDVAALQELVLWGVACNVDSLPWAQLTSLTLEFVNWQDIYSILSHCISLIYCKISFCNADHEDLPLFNIRLPNLEILMLLLEINDAGLPTEYLDADILRHFTLPSLQRLQVSDYFVGVSVPQLEALVERSQCKLRSLQITGNVPRGPWLAQECLESDLFKEIDVACLEIDEDFHGYWQEDEYWKPVPAPEESV